MPSLSQHDVDWELLENMLISRRYLLCAGALPFVASVPARGTDYLDLGEVIGGSAGPHSVAIGQAFALAKARGLKVVARAGTYVLDDDFVVDWDGFHLEGEGEGTRFIQTTPMKGFLQLRGNGNTVRGIRFACDFERSREPGRWRGYGNFQRVCAVWAEGSSNVIENVSGENSFGVVCLRGPVIPVGNGSEYGENFDYTRRAMGNRVLDISGHNTDFVLTGNQQEDLVIDGVTARSTTSRSVPPHAIYMQNPGSTKAFCGFSLRVQARRLNSIGNTYAEAFKFSDVRDLVIEDVQASDTAGGLMISTSDGVIVKGGTWKQNSGVNKGHAAIRVSQSARVRIAGGTATHGGGGVVVYHESEAVDVEAFAVVDRFSASIAGTPFRVQDRSEARFIGCTRERQGIDRPMFVVADSATGTIDKPVSRGSARLVQTSVQGTVNLRIDPALVDGWDPAKSILGAKERVRLYSGPPPQSPVSHPLPGAPDNVCTP